MLEKRLAAVPPQAFTADGGTGGQVTIANTRLFKVKQEVNIIAIGQPDLNYEVKRVLTETTMIVGPKSSDMKGPFPSIAAYTVAANSFIYANEKQRPIIPFEEYMRAIYEEEPTVAMRTMLVDKLGRDYRTDNPLPVQLSDGSINIGTVNAQIEMFLSHRDNDPHSGDVHSSLRIGDGTDELAINSDGSINVVESLGPGNAGKSFYNEVSSVPSSSLITVLTYTVPPSTTAKLNRVDVSGTNIATYQVEINASIVDKKRTYFSGPLNEVFEFNGVLSMVAGDVLTVRVEHQRPDMGDFNARVQLVEGT